MGRLSLKTSWINFLGLVVTFSYLSHIYLFSYKLGQRSVQDQLFSFFSVGLCGKRSVVGAGPCRQAKTTQRQMDSRQKRGSHASPPLLHGEPRHSLTNPANNEGRNFSLTELVFLSDIFFILVINYLWIIIDDWNTANFDKDCKIVWLRLWIFLQFIKMQIINLMTSWRKAAF